MKRRRLVLPVVLVLVASNVAAAAPAPPASSAPLCVASVDDNGRVSRLSVSAKAVSFCVTGADPKTSCFVIDRATGTYSRARGSVPASPAPPKRGPAAKHSIAVHIANSVGVSVDVLDAQHKRVATFTPADYGNFPCQAAQMLGDTIVVDGNQCGMMRSTMTLYTPAGVSLGQIAGGGNTAYAVNVPLGGPLYAFALPHEHRVIVVDITTNKQSHDIQLPPLGTGSDDITMAGPSYQMIALPDDTVAIASGIGNVVIVDLNAEHIVTSWTAPACAPVP